MYHESSTIGLRVLIFFIYKNMNLLSVDLLLQC